MPDAPMPTEAPFSYVREMRRKVLHLLALAVPAGMVWLGAETALWLLLPAALLGVAGDIARVRLPTLRRWIQTLFGPMMRPSEWTPLGGPIRLNGATWLLLSALLLTVVFPLSIAATTLAIFMLGDAAAALVGRRYGRHPWPGSPRTLEGSASFLVVGGLAAAALPNVGMVTGAVCVGTACLFEALPGPLNDNLRVPFLAALAWFCTERFFIGQDVLLFSVFLA